MAPTVADTSASANDLDSVSYAGSNSVDSGYKSSCPTPDLVSADAYYATQRSSALLTLNARPNAANKATPRNATDVDLLHLASLRQTLLKAIERYESVQTPYYYATTPVTPAATAKRSTSPSPPRSAAAQQPPPPPPPIKARSSSVNARSSTRKASPDVPKRPWRNHSPPASPQRHQSFYRSYRQARNPRILSNEAPIQNGRPHAPPPPPPLPPTPTTPTDGGALHYGACSAKAASLKNPTIPQQQHESTLQQDADGRMAWCPSERIISTSPSTSSSSSDDETLTQISSVKYEGKKKK